MYTHTDRLVFSSNKHRYIIIVECAQTIFPKQSISIWYVGCTCVFTLYRYNITIFSYVFHPWKKWFYSKNWIHISSARQNRRHVCILSQNCSFQIIFFDSFSQKNKQTKSFVILQRIVISFIFHRQDDSFNGFDWIRPKFLVNEWNSVPNVTIEGKKNLLLWWRS